MGKLREHMPALIITGLVCFLTGALSPSILKNEVELHKSKERNFAYTSALVEACIQTAAGTNQVLEVQEARDLAIKLGYAGIFQEDETAMLHTSRNPANPAYLAIGNNPKKTLEIRTRENVKQYALRLYLSNENPEKARKLSENFNY